MDSSRWFEQDSSICNGVQAVQTFHLLAKLTLSQISLVWNKNHVYLPYCLHSTLAEGHHPTEAEESTAKAALFLCFFVFLFFPFPDHAYSCQTSWQCSQSLTHFFLIHFLFARFEMCLGHLVNSESGFISIGFSLSRGSTPQQTSRQVISSRLISRVSSIVACLIILSVQATGHPKMGNGEGA